MSSLLSSVFKESTESSEVSLVSSKGFFIIIIITELVLDNIHYGLVTAIAGFYKVLFR